MKNEKTLSARNPGGFSLLSFVIEHREVPLMAVLVALLAGVSIAVPGYFTSNYMNILKNSSMNLVMDSIVRSAALRLRFSIMKSSA